jgi:4-hydroxybenzoate polyprenyltransferase
VSALQLRVGTAGATLKNLGHLGLWSGAYVSAAVVCFLQLARIVAAPDAWVAAIVFAGAVASGVYLLDRVKLRDRWLDPADALAHPGRYAYLSGRTRQARLLAAGFLIVGIVAGMWVSAWAAGVGIAAVLGVIVYAGRARGQRARPKDLLVIKNFYVAAGITGFAVTIAVGMGGVDSAAYRWPSWVFGSAMLLGRVLADAAICDLDDEEADRRYLTSTLPTRLGRVAAWNWAMGFRLLVMVAIATIPLGPRNARWSWAIATGAGIVVLRAWNPEKVRDAVDLRLPAEAVAATLLAWMFSAFSGPN